MRHLPGALFFCSTVLVSSLLAQDASTNSYLQTNLTSDVSGLAAHTDPNLVNAWGIAFIGTGPWWVNSAGKGLSIIYQTNGTPVADFTIPPPSTGGPSVPTGIVSNSTSDFQLTAGHPALFLFATALGTIAGWNGGSSAVTQITTPNASYTGLTIAQIAGKNFLYAANFANNSVDVFNASFQPISLGTGAFQDSMVPAGFAPFNVQNIGGAVYVTFAEVGPDGRSVAGAGLGYVDKFSAAGKLLLRLEHGNWMNAPWGLVAAPATGFGPLSGQLLVGNFGSGAIAAFNPSTGVITTVMKNTAGKTLVIPFLWGIRFGNGGSAGPANTLFFAAGPSSETHGLFRIGNAPVKSLRAIILGGGVSTLSPNRQDQAA